MKSQGGVDKLIKESMATRQFNLAGATTGTFSSNLHTGMVMTRRQAQPLDFRLGRQAWRYTAVALFATASLFYINQAARGSAEQSQIAKLEAEIHQVDQDKGELETKRSDFQALTTIEGSREKFALEPVSKPDFVVTPGGGFAAR